jgi:hypothetical protein
MPASFSIADADLDALYQKSVEDALTPAHLSHTLEKLMKKAESHRLVHP